MLFSHVPLRGLLLPIISIEINNIYVFMTEMASKDRWTQMDLFVLGVGIAVAAFLLVSGGLTYWVVNKINSRGQRPSPPETNRVSRTIPGSRSRDSK